MHFTKINSLEETKKSSEINNISNDKREDFSMYVVFPCSKCYQYTYGKKDQKGKKCPRCGRYHKMEDVLNGTYMELVETLKEANLLVRRKQNTYSEKRYGNNPYLSTVSSSFLINPKKSTKRKKVTKNFTEQEVKNDFERGNNFSDFCNILDELKEKYTQGPIKIFDMFFRKKGFTYNEIKRFKSIAINKKKITMFNKERDNLYYRIIS